MQVTVERIDEVNIIINGVIEKKNIDIIVNRQAIAVGKTINVDGFRKGKIPAHIVKKLHGKKLVEDAESEILTKIIDTAIVDNAIIKSDILGKPTFKKYDKQEDGNIKVALEISIKPKFDLDGYQDVFPEFKKPVISDDRINEELEKIALQYTSYVKIAEARAVKNGDMTLIDFEGFIDGVAFEGGQAENFNLTIGSNQFIPGFEEQIIGMQYAEEKIVTVTFPAEYQSADLAGKDADFKVTLHEIQEKGAVELNDALAQKIFTKEQNVTLEILKDRVKSEIESLEVSKTYNEVLKPKILEALVAKFDFALPNNIVEQEIDVKIDIEAQNMSEEEIASYKNNEKKLNELRDSVREEAKDSVKATFIIDALAKKETIEVSDQEVTKVIYYEAKKSGQDPEEVMKHYQDNNLLSGVKMGMIEDKLFGKILGLES